MSVVMGSEVTSPLDCGTYHSECGCTDKASGFFLNSLACIFREIVGSCYRSVHAVWQMLAFFLFLPRAAGILSWESPIIRAHPLIPHSSPSPHPCKRNSSLEKPLHGRGILPFWGLLCHCPNYSHSKHWAWLHFISAQVPALLRRLCNL